MDQQPLHPNEGSPAVIEALQSLSGKVEVLTERVARLKSLCERVMTESDIGWVEELRSKLVALESLPALVKEIEESAKINMIHGTQIREEIGELNRQLRFVGTALVDQLKILVKD